MPQSKDWFEFEQFEDGELQALMDLAKMWPRHFQLFDKILRALHERDRIFDLMRGAADIDQKLLDMKDSVLDLVPECPLHGKHCSSFQCEWVEKMVQIEEQINIVRAAARLDMAKDCK